MLVFPSRLGVEDSNGKAPVDGGSARSSLADDPKHWHTTAMLSYTRRIGCLFALSLVCFLGLEQAYPADGKPAHFHHIQLNVTDPQATQKFYERFFGALPMRYRGKVPGVFTERSFILLAQVDQPPRTHEDTSLWHLGWAGVDGPSEFAWRKQAGVPVHTPLTALANDHYMYFSGPSGEIVEIYTGSRNHRFEHVHLLATDVNVTIQWFVDHLRLTPNRKSVPPPPPDADVNSMRGIWMNAIRVDNVNLVVFGRPKSAQTPFWLPLGLPAEPLATEGSAINHIAFSYRDIEPEYERLKSQGATIKSPPRNNPTTGHRSFFLLAPDKLLVEIVEAKPLPEGSWE